MMPITIPSVAPTTRYTTAILSSVSPIEILPVFSTRRVYAPAAARVSGDPSADSCQARCDLPEIAPGIFDHAPAIAVRRVERLFDRRGATRERAAVRGFYVGDVDVEECGVRHSLARVADHQSGIADLDDGRHRALVVASARED